MSEEISLAPFPLLPERKYQVLTKQRRRLVSYHKPRNDEEYKASRTSTINKMHQCLTYDVEDPRMRIYHLLEDRLKLRIGMVCTS